MSSIFDGSYFKKLELPDTNSLFCDMNRGRQKTFKLTSEQEIPCQISDQKIRKFLKREIHTTIQFISFHGLCEIFRQYIHKHQLYDPQNPEILVFTASYLEYVFSCSLLHYSELKYKIRNKVTFLAQFPLHNFYNMFVWPTDTPAENALCFVPCIIQTPTGHLSAYVATYNCLNVIPFQHKVLYRKYLPLEERNVNIYINQWTRSHFELFICPIVCLGNLNRKIVCEVARSLFDVHLFIKNQTKIECSTIPAKLLSTEQIPTSTQDKWYIVKSPALLKFMHNYGRENQFYFRFTDIACAYLNFVSKHFNEIRTLDPLIYKIKGTELGMALNCSYIHLSSQFTLILSKLTKIVEDPSQFFNI